MAKLNKNNDNKQKLYGGYSFNSDEFNVEDKTRTYEEQKEKFLADQKEKKDKAKIAKLEAEQKKLEALKANNEYNYVHVKVDNQKNDDLEKKYSDVKSNISTAPNSNNNSPGRNNENDNNNYEYMYNKMIPKNKKQNYEYINNSIKNNKMKGNITEDPWKKYIDHNKSNNPTFAKVLKNLDELANKGESGAKVNINGVKLNNGELELVQSSESALDPYNEKLWAGGRFLLRFDTPDGADEFLASIDTSALYRREAATHGSKYRGKELVEKKESGISALFKGLFFGTHYGVDMANDSTEEVQSPGHLYINKENHTLKYYASKIPLVGSYFKANHYSEIQIGIENHEAPGVFRVFLDKTGIKKAAHSTSGESDGINPIGDAKNIYKVKLDDQGNIKNQDGLKSYLGKADVADKNITDLKGEWSDLGGNSGYQYKQQDDLYFVKDPKANVFVVNPKTLKDGGEVIFDIHGKVIDVEDTSKVTPVNEDSFTLKDTRDVLHGAIVMPQAYSLTKSIAKEVVDPFPKAFGFNHNISEYISEEDKQLASNIDEVAISIGNRVSDIFNYGFNTLTGKPIEFIKAADVCLGGYPSNILSIPYEYMIKPMAQDGLNATFNALNFYFDGWSIFVNPAINSVTGVVDNHVEQYAPTDESSSAYTYGYNSFYAGYSFGKHYMLHANNTGLHKTTFSSEKFAGAIGKTVGDVNRQNNIEEEVKDEDVGVITYALDAGVIYGLTGNSTTPTEKKWLPVKLATSLVSYSLKASAFYNAHNAIKYLDNKFGVSSGTAKALDYLNTFSYLSAEGVNVRYVANEGEQGGEKNTKEENKKTESESTLNNNYLKLFGYYINNFKAEDKEFKYDDLQNIIDNENDNQINTKEIININEQKVDSGTQDDTIEVGNEYEDLIIMVNNSTTLTYSELDDPCDIDDILCEIKDDIYANSTLWT